MDVLDYKSMNKDIIGEYDWSYVIVLSGLGDTIRGKDSPRETRGENLKFNVLGFLRH